MFRGKRHRLQRSHRLRESLEPEDIVENQSPVILTSTLGTKGMVRRSGHLPRLPRHIVQGLFDFTRRLDS